MQKKQLTGILLLSALGSTFSINKIFAGYEIGDKGVEVELALDYFKSHKIRSSEYWIYDDGVFNNPYDRVDFNILYNNQYDLTKLAQQGYRTNNDFVLRYHATGFQEDTWANKELQIQVGLSTQSAKTSSIWLLQWTDSSHTTYSYQERPKANIG